MERNAQGQFVSRKIDWLNGEYEELQHALVSGLDREPVDVEKQEEFRRSVEAELFNEEQSYEEYRKARKAAPLLIAEPHRPLDEMSLKDYRNTREKEKRDLPHLDRDLEPGEMSFEDYLRIRKLGWL
jgi:hypothetical protein